MLRVRVQDIKPHMRLARPIPLPNCPTRYLVQRDALLTSAMARRLEELGIPEVWVRCDELAFLEDVIDTELQERQRELYANIRQNFERVMRISHGQLDITCFQESVSSLFEYLKRKTVGMTFLDKVQIFDQYLMCHSANVCYLAMLLAMKLDWYLIEERLSVTAREAKDVAALGLGCLLHDIGKLRIPREILDKPSRLNGEEMRQMRMHPFHGYRMVKGLVPTSAAQVVLHHHQRFDGKGYPTPAEMGLGEDFPLLSGRRIHVFARIATVADVFDAATSKRVYSDAKPSVQVLHEILKFNRGSFDPVVEQALFEVVPPFPIGAMVKLDNGMEAAVVDFDPEDPCRPQVLPVRYADGERCVYPDNREIELSQTPELSIESVGGVDVRAFLFEKADVLRAEAPVPAG